MAVRKLLYSILEAGTYQQATYYKYYKEKLSIVTSTYNPYLLVSTKKDMFRVVRMQTDDMLILALPAFAKLEDNKL